MKSYEYSTTALAAGRAMGVRMDEEMVHDVVTSLWESHERFLDKVGGHGRKLKKAEIAELNNRLFIRARFAIVDIIRFRTWRPPHTKNPQLQEMVTVGSKMDYFETLAYSDNAEDAVINNIDIGRIREYYMVREYSLGETMKEIGRRRGISESAISQKFHKLTYKAACKGGLFNEEA
jgi:hypothetical protein